MVLIRGARQLMTLRGLSQPRRGDTLKELGIIHDGALLIENGRIVEVGVSRRVENLARSRGVHEIDATGRVVMPGFVDCHTHLVSGCPRQNGCEANLAGSGETVTRPGFASRVSAKWLEGRARQIVHGMVRHGTTTLEAKSGCGIDETGELKILRALAKLHRRPVDVVPTFLSPQPMLNGSGRDAAAYMSWMCADLLPKIRRRRLAHFADFQWDERVFTLDQTNQFLDTVRQIGFPLKIHAGRFDPDAGVRLAVTQGAISTDHLDVLESSSVDLLARAKTIAVLLPGSAFHLGLDRYAPSRALIDAGAAVALATDFDPGGSQAYSMQAIVGLACARMRMSPAEALCAATFNAACAAGCADRAGSIEVGKDADLIILHVPDYREIPLHFGVNLVRTTIKRGAVIYDEAKVSA